jgi:predicted nicotinamide N-methyase
MITQPKRETALFESINGVAFYCGLTVEHHRIRVWDDTVEIAALKDAAALLDDAEVVRECEKTDRLPYGFELWPAALMLSEYLYRSEPGQRRRAIELGCGVGLVSIAAAKTGWRIVSTDGDPVPLRFAAFNAAANAVEVEAYQLLDWHNPPSDSRFSRVLAADVLYQRCDHEPILNCIGQLLEDGGVAIIADPNRRVADDFASLAEAGGFCVEITQAGATLDHQAPVAGRLFVVRRP